MMTRRLVGVDVYRDDDDDDDEAGRDAMYSNNTYSGLNNKKDFI